MKKINTMVLTFILTITSVSIFSVHAQNMAFGGGGGGGRTIYGKWKLVNYGGFGVNAAYKCTRTVYYPNGVKRKQNKRATNHWFKRPTC